MSYTLSQSHPEDLEFFFYAPDEKLFVSFTCPRCNRTINKELDLADLVTGFEVDCDDPHCKAKGERYGYRLTFTPDWSESILGLSDRPLHNEDKP